MDSGSERETVAADDSFLAKTKSASGKRRGGFRPRKRKKAFARLGSLQRKANQRERRRAQRIRDGFRNLAEALAASGVVGAVAMSPLADGGDSTVSAEHDITDTSGDGKVSANYGTDWTQISTLTTACAYIGHLGRLLHLNGGAEEIAVSQVPLGRCSHRQTPRNSVDDESDLDAESDAVSEGEEENMSQTVLYEPDVLSVKCSWSLRQPAKRRCVDKSPEKQPRTKTERFSFVPADLDQVGPVKCDSCTLCELWNKQEVAVLRRKQGGECRRLIADANNLKRHFSAAEVKDEVIAIPPQLALRDARPAAAPVGENAHVPSVHESPTENNEGASRGPKHDDITTATEAVSALLTLGNGPVCFNSSSRSPPSASLSPMQLEEDSKKGRESGSLAKQSPPEQGAGPAVDHHLHFSGYTMATAKRKRMSTWRQPVVQPVTPGLPTPVVLPQPHFPWPQEVSSDPFQVILVPTGCSQHLFVAHSSLAEPSNPLVQTASSTAAHLEAPSQTAILTSTRLGIVEASTGAGSGLFAMAATAAGTLGKELNNDSAIPVQGKP